MTQTAARFVDAALEALNAGFTSKSGQQRAIEDLNRAYERGVKGSIHDELLTVDFADRSGDWDDLYWGLPDLHNWKAKHSELFARYPESVALAERLVDLRAAVKAAPVDAPVRREPSRFEVKARETLMELIQRRRAQYLEAVSLGEVFGGLPVSASTHLVTNEQGTTFLRTFYYLAGRFTPLNVIVAAAEELARRGEARG